jgi:sugar phosphate permease
MLRSVFAIVGGYITFAISVALTTAVVAHFFPAFFADGAPTSQFIAINLGYSGIAAVFAGFISGLAAGREPLKHAVMLAALCTLYFLLFLGAPTPPGEPVFPAWYKIGLLVVVPPGICLGGFLRQQQAC